MTKRSEQKTEMNKGSNICNNLRPLAYMQLRVTSTIPPTFKKRLNQAKTQSVVLWIVHAMHYLDYGHCLRFCWHCFASTSHNKISTAAPTLSATLQAILVTRNEDQIPDWMPRYHIRWSKIRIPQIAATILRSMIFC